MSLEKDSPCCREETRYWPVTGLAGMVEHGMSVMRKESNTPQSGRDRLDASGNRNGRRGHRMPGPTGPKTQVELQNRKLVNYLKPSET